MLVVMFVILVLIPLIIFAIGIPVIIFATTWKIFDKAGKPGWASLLPVYNMIIILEIVRRPAWWIALFFVPFAGTYAGFKVAMDLAECFGKSRTWGFFMLTFLAIIGYPVLAFSDAQYTAPARQA